MFSTQLYVMNYTFKTLIIVKRGSIILIEHYNKHIINYENINSIIISVCYESRLHNALKRGERRDLESINRKYCTLMNCHI